MKELVEVIAKSLVENPDEVVVTETEKEDKPYPPGGVCPACGAGAQPGAFDWMRLGRQHDRGGKEE